GHPATTDAERSKLAAVADEQRQIKEELRQLQADLRRHAADAQTDFPKAAASATKIADEIGQRQIPVLMQAAQGGYVAQTPEQGYAISKRALEQMEAMIGTCNGTQADCKGELDLKLSRSLGKPGLDQSLTTCLNP